MLAVTSCSDNDYMNVIPRDCIAVMRIDVSKAVSGLETDTEVGLGILKSILDIDDIKESGIDFTKPLYAFEASDGSLGIVAKVGSKAKIDSWLKDMNNKEMATEVKERKGFCFSIIKGSYIAGYSGSALLVMGPVVSSAAAEVQRRMVRYLDCGEDNNAMLMQHLDTMDGSIALVAQAKALPEKFIAPFMTGVPKSAKPADIIISASLNMKEHSLNIACETFSFKPEADSALKESMKAYKPIKCRHIGCIPSDMDAAVICGADGDALVGLLRRNETFRVMLAGFNMAIDIDKMLRSVNGDMIMSLGNIGNIENKSLDFSIIAETSDDTWLEDVGYWKTSTPSGTSITDWKHKDSYHLKGGEWNVFFGLASDKKMYICSSESLASDALTCSSVPFPKEVMSEIRGKRLCVVINIRRIISGNPQITALSGIPKDLEWIVCSTK